VLSSAKDYSGSKGYNTMKAFVGYSHPQYTVGAEAFWHTNKKSGLENVTTSYDDVKKEYKLVTSVPTDVIRFGYSAFASLITPIPKVKLYARYDFFDNNTEENVITKFDKTTGKLTGGLDDEYRLIIAGLDYIPSGNVHLMPNIMIKSYTKAGLDRDITARLTFYYKFDSGKIVVN
jgi:hypothetical protein